MPFGNSGCSFGGIGLTTAALDMITGSITASLEFNVDFITQTMLGAVAAQATMTGKLGRRAVLLGAAGGLLPDLDVFLEGITDPAVPFELHRHFTHSLLFIPLGAALATLPFLAFPWFRNRMGWSYLAALIGIATHGLLDNLTSYGTHLYWPFVAERTSWDAMPIVDPIFSGMLILGILFTVIFKRARPAIAAFALCCGYITLGFVQHVRAMNVQHQLAELRGHEIDRGRVLPTVGNVMLWRSIYQCDGVLHADAVRVSLFDEIVVREGGSMASFTLDDLPEDVTPRVRDLYTRFSMFADHYTVLTSVDNGKFYIGDVRFCLPTSSFNPLWGFYVESDQLANPAYFSGHGPRNSPRREDDALSNLWNEIIGRGDNYVHLSLLTNNITPVKH